MPGPTYLAAYQNKRLNEVVIPGAHDAGIFLAGRTNVQTQALDIAHQAADGCRFFDMRIAAQKQKTGGVTTYTHKAYHLNDALIISSKAKGNPNVSKHQTVAHLGGWGGDLVTMLNQANAFVQAHPTEFLILKFSKCFNWPDIARTCFTHLQGQSWYTQYGNLNNRTVQELSGHVITVFAEKARKEINPIVASHTGQAHGILYFRELYDADTGTSKTYDPAFSGMQYFGKFSSTDDIDKNTRKQTETLTAGAATHMDVLGMMYWTTTGLFGNIQTRNDQMWITTDALRQTWRAGLQASIEDRLGRERNAAVLAAQWGALGGRLKSFMPNIVMMDFVDLAKCNTVDGLNAVAGQDLRRLIIKPPVPPRPARVQLGQARGGPPPIPPRPARAGQV
jgi:hypothetical protein